MEEVKKKTTDTAERWAGGDEEDKEDIKRVEKVDFRKVKTKNLTN